MLGAPKKGPSMPRSSWRTPTVMLVCGSILLTIALGVRHGFGLFLQPMSMDQGWGREVFGFAVALQNLIWGITQPFTGMLADRFGAGRVLFVGGLLYALGVFGMANAGTPLALVVSLGVLVGVGMSCTTFNIVFGALGRAYAPERRSGIFGVASAAGSLGQFLLMPLALVFITTLGWQAALIALSAVAAMVAPLSLGVADKGYGAHASAAGSTSREAISLAVRQKGFWLLGIGYFTCGFQIVFIGTHFPAFVIDQGLTAKEGTVALALIGLFNVFGSFGAGYLGNRIAKTYLLSGIYAFRGMAILLLLAFPVTSVSVYLFAACFGIAWLATVPLTNGVVAGIFGVRHLAMLSGAVFLFHQIGSFVGGWLGGYVFDQTGSYQLVWIIAIGLSIISTVVNIPIDERPLREATASA